MNTNQKTTYPQKLAELFKNAKEYAKMEHNEVYGLYTFRNKIFSDDDYVRDPDEIDDRDLPFNTLLVDLTDQKLPVHIMGFSTEGRVIKISDSLESYLQLFLREPGAPDPETALQDSLAKTKKLYKNAEHDLALEVIAATLKQYEGLSELEDGHGNIVRTLLGAHYNLKGLIQKKKKDLTYVKSFERSFELGDENSLLNLMDTCCYDLGEYEKAIKLARRPVYGNYPGFYKIKADAYASLNLGDIQRATKCYKILHNEYFRKDDKKAAKAREELEELAKSSSASPDVLKYAQEILSWFAIEKTQSETEKEEKPSVVGLPGKRLAKAI